MRSLGWLSVAGMVALGACGDDAAAAEPCPMTLMAGQTQVCMCDAVMTGSQTCGDNGFLTECVCEPGAPTLTGGTGATATGGGGGEGGTSSTTGTGGAGGTMAPPMDEDAGMPMGGSGGSGAGGTGGTEPTVPTVPMDGSQNAYCESGLDCNKGLDCYLPTGTGAGYCTIPCMGDMACMALAGANYTCSGEGLCRVTCTGADDTKSCPDGMECLPGIIGPTGGPRCNWPEGGVPAGGTEAYGQCMTSAACADGLMCAVPFSSPFPGSGGTGYCTKPCMANTDCPEAPKTGDIPATCQPGELGSMMGICALDCFGAPMGCPDGMTCQSFAGGFFRRCAY